MKVSLKLSPRGSGKSTKILMKAIKFHFKGKGVYIILRNQEEVKQFKRRLLEFVPPENNIKVISQDEAYKPLYNRDIKKVFLLDEYNSFKSEEFGAIMKMAKAWNVKVIGYSS